MVYLVDFGFTTRYRLAGQHVAWQRCGHIGTLKYNSIHTHKGEHSRRSDVEALGYVLIDLATGRLPWQGALKADRPEEEKRARQDEILADKKHKTKLEEHVRHKL